MSYNTFKKMKRQSTLLTLNLIFNKKGSLSYGELLVKSKSKKGNINFM